ncbi:MAG: type IV secretory system conjugative DNA transfer family protein [Endozoicomonas sp.]
MDPDGKGLNDHWSKTGQSLLTAVIIHCCYLIEIKEGRRANLADISYFIATPEKTREELFMEMLEYKHLGDEVHPLVAQEAQAMLNTEDKELSSIISTARSFLTLYRDPVVAKNTRKSDFSIRDLMNNEQPISLYLVVKPSDSDRLRPLIRLMLTQIVQMLTQEMKFEDGKSVAHYKHRLLLMLDEFASLKRLSVIETALSFMAGYGIKAYLIVQDIQQILKEYSREEGILGNCHIRIAYSPNKVETAEVLSKMSGQTTIVRKQLTISGKRFGLMQGQSSESLQEVQRPLITADEVMRLPAPIKDSGDKILKAGDMLVFASGHAPIYGKQILYFLDPTFSARSKVLAPRRSDTLAKVSHEITQEEDSVPQIYQVDKAQDTDTSAELKLA